MSPPSSRVLRNRLVRLRNLRLASEQVANETHETQEGFPGRWTRRQWAQVSIVATMIGLLGTIVPGFATVLAPLARAEGRSAAFLARALRDAGATAPLPPAPAAAGSVLATRVAERLLDRTTRLEAPAFAAPDPATTAATATVALERARARLCAVLHAADGRDTATLRRAHHVLGELTFAQWIAFAGYHERRHTAQVRELGASLMAG